MSPARLVTRTAHRLDPDPRRVVSKLFVPGEEAPRSRSRAAVVIDRILALDEAEVSTLIDGVMADFRDRHRDLTDTFARHFAVVEHEILDRASLTPQRRALIGAYFTHEYSPEAAALFNPSMVAHPDQSGLAPGQLRFVMTVRCVGEGHLSSIGFRTGILGPAGALTVDEPGPLLTTGITRAARYCRDVFLRRLLDLGNDEQTARLVLGELPTTFDARQLDDAVHDIHEHTANRQRVRTTVDHVRRVASAIYDLEFPAETALSERLLWPSAPAESHGMEDARLVRFVDDDGTVTYHATYTAYDGLQVASHLLSTKDFLHFHVTPMAGRAAQNKGVALFPRRINGRYLALSRSDRESTALVDSDDLRIWNEPTALHTPAVGWELIQVGNCGSPIETPAGWLVLTHGVGPMRVYGLGAMVLSLNDPSIVLGSLEEPLLVPAADERDGYVPNVVYSCGGQLHDGVLTIPYGISDTAIRFAQVHIAALLARILA